MCNTEAKIKKKYIKKKKSRLMLQVSNGPFLSSLGTSYHSLHHLQKKTQRPGIIHHKHSLILKIKLLVDTILTCVRQKSGFSPVLNFHLQLAHCSLPEKSVILVLGIMWEYSKTLGICMSP